MDFVRVLESLENLIFEIALWVIFVPKTLLKVVLRPTWIWAYASGELQKDKVKRYDDYLSPLLFWLIVAVIPVASHECGRCDFVRDARCEQSQPHC